MRGARTITDLSALHRSRSTDQHRSVKIGLSLRTALNRCDYLFLMRREITSFLHASDLEGLMRGEESECTIAFFLPSTSSW